MQLLRLKETWARSAYIIVVVAVVGITIYNPQFCHRLSIEVVPRVHNAIDNGSPDISSPYVWLSRKTVLLKRAGRVNYLNIPLVRVYRKPSHYSEGSLASYLSIKIMYLRRASMLAAGRTTGGAVRRLSSGKDVKFGVEGRELMLQGVDMLADAVQVRPGWAYHVGEGYNAFGVDLGDKLDIALPSCAD